MQKIYNDLIEVENFVNRLHGAVDALSANCIEETYDSTFNKAYKEMLYIENLVADSKDRVKRLEEAYSPTTSELLLGFIDGITKEFYNSLYFETLLKAYSDRSQFIPDKPNFMVADINNDGNYSVIPALYPVMGATYFSSVEVARHAINLALKDLERRTIQ